MNRNKVKWNVKLKYDIGSECELKMMVHVKVSVTVQMVNVPHCVKINCLINCEIVV